MTTCVAAQVRVWPGARVTGAQPVMVASASVIVTLVNVVLPVFVATSVKGTTAPTDEKVLAVDDLDSVNAADVDTTGLTSMFADAWAVTG